MKLSVARFNAMLNNVAQTVTWRAGYDCPCKNPDSGAPQYGCAVCSGMGVYWAGEQIAKTALASQKVQREWANFGLWENGDVILTIPSDSGIYAMGEFDRVVFTESSEPFSVTRVHDGTDALQFPVVSVDKLFWLVKNQPVDGGIPTVAAGGALSWLAGEPPQGAQYSICGRKHPEYFCYGNFPQDRAHQGGLALPRRVVLRRFDLFGRSGS